MNAPESRTDHIGQKDFWDKLSSLGGPAVALVLGVGACSVNQGLKDRDVRVRMVELAIEILKENPEDPAPTPELREWAGNLVNLYSGVPLRSQSATGAAVSLSTKATAASFAGYAHVTITSEPPGALVWFLPNEYPEVAIPAPGPTPTEVNLLAGTYGVKALLGDEEQMLSAFLFYNKENTVHVSFE